MKHGSVAGASCLLSLLTLMFAGRAVADSYAETFSAFSRMDYVRALGLVQPLVEQGGPEAENLLGVMYENGDGVPKDRGKAVELYRKAGEQGLAEAQFYLAQKTTDPAEAAKWYLKAAQQHYVLAMSDVAKLYEGFGGGLPHDQAKALYWWQQAA